MADNFDRYNDGSQNPPRLRVQQSAWALSGLPMNSPQQWSLDEKCAHAKTAGFEAIEYWLDEASEQTTKDALESHGLRLVLGHSPHSLDDVRKTAAQAVRVGADYVFSHPLNPYVPMSEAVPFLREAQRIVNDHGLAYFVETHRGNIPESLNQALELIALMPEIRLTGDFSHFVLVGEFYGWKEEGAIDKMQPVLQRTAHLHGRISNGEQSQVDVGDGSGETAQFFVRIWAEAMRHWLQGAGPGDVLPFTSELGPPRYAITLLDGTEFSDRWEQSLVMKRLAEQAWATALAAKA